MEENTKGFYCYDCYCYIGIGASIDILLAYLVSDRPELAFSFGSIIYNEVYVLSLAWPAEEFPIWIY